MAKSVFLFVVILHLVYAWYYNNRLVPLVQYWSGKISIGFGQLPSLSPSTGY